jgi:hypothetical protein
MVTMKKPGSTGRVTASADVSSQFPLAVRYGRFGIHGDKIFEVRSRRLVIDDTVVMAGMSIWHYRASIRQSERSREIIAIKTGREQHCRRVAGHYEGRSLLTISSLLQ